MKITRNVTIFISLISLILIFYITHNCESTIPSIASIENIEKPTVRSSFSSKNREDVQERFEYEFARLKDPVSNKIPSNIRTKELNFANDSLVGIGVSFVIKVGAFPFLGFTCSGLP